MTARQRAPRGRGEDLRVEIVAATKRLLADAADSSAVSIRAVADSVGVTAPAIYLHFADKDALLGAVVADVFAALEDALLAAAEGIDHPLGRLRAFGRAFAGFAVTHPEHYRLALMERGNAGDQRDVDGPMALMDEVLRQGAFAQFRKTVQVCMDDGIYAPGDAWAVALQLWAAAHGIASLLVTKPYAAWGGDPLDIAEHVVWAAALGQATNDLLGGTAAPEAAAEWLRAQRP